MKKAAEKSAVRWSCAVLAVLFFFLASTAWTLRRMQQTYGCAEDDTAAQDALVSKLFDSSVQDLAKAARPYFEFEGAVILDCPPQFQSENTNFRFSACDDAGNVILNTIDENEGVLFRETKTTVVEVPASDGDRFLRAERMPQYPM